MACLDGIRVLAIAWVILGHTFFFAAKSPSINPDEVVEITKRFFTAHIYNGTISLEIFFFISGFLFVYILMEKSQGHPRFSFWIFIHRILRFYPLLLFSLAFFCFVLPSLGYGPMYYNIYEEVEVYCEHIWYQILLFFANFRPWGYNCIDYVWYICLDFQLFLLAPFIILLYSWKRFMGYFVPLAIIIGNIITTIILALNFDIWGVVGKYNREYEDIYYEKPYTRAGPYMIGIMLGFAYYEYRSGAETRLSKLMGKIESSVILRGLCYLVGLGGAFFMIQSMYWLNKDASSLSRSVDLIFLLFNRNAFTLSILILVLPSLAGKGRVLKLLLGNDFFYVLGKLSYGAYMVHVIYMEYVAYTAQSPIYFSYMHLFMSFCGYLLISFASAFILHLFLELPIFGLEGLLLPKPTRPHSAAKDDVNELLPMLKKMADQHSLFLGLILGFLFVTENTLLVLLLSKTEFSYKKNSSILGLENSQFKQ